MTSQQAPVVVDLSDSDDSTAASPHPSLRKRSLATTPPSAAAFTSPEFSPSRPLQKRLAPTNPILLLDDTPSPPNRRRGPSETLVPVALHSMPPQSVVPRSLDDRTPGSLLPCSSRAGPFFTGCDIADGETETPSLNGSRSAGHSAAPASSAAASPHKHSGPSCLISVDSDGDEFAQSGGTSCLKASMGSDHDLDESGDSTLQEEETHNKEENAQLIEERYEKQKEKRLNKEEKARLIEEKRRNRQENKMQKEAEKIQRAEQKKLDKEKENWESGKFALKSIVAEIDPAIIESGSVGGDIVSRFDAKELKCRIKTNPVSGSILWKMEVPEIGQYPASVSEVPYILFVLQAEEFCDLVSGGRFFDHVCKVQRHYPTFTICYVTNKLMNYVNKCRKRPPVEKVLCKLATHYVRVHSRQCADEAEVADHVVGLTCSLANCKFRKPLTWLSVHANGAIIPKGFVDKALFKKDTWLKSLIAIPKVQPRFALAIWKEYRTMRSLLNVYMDPSKTDREKELLLQDLMCEGPLGDANRRLGPVCSKRVFRILMALHGAMDTADAEKSS